MTNWRRWAILFAAGMLLVASSLAFHYRSRSLSLERELETAMAKLLMLGDDAGDKPASAPAPAHRELPARTWELPRVDEDAGARAGADRRTAERTSAAVEGAAPPEADRGGRRGTNWMEALRTNDPARYEEIQQRRQETQQRVEDAWAKRSNHFQNRDTSAMSEMEIQEYDLMVSLFEQTRTLSQLLQAGLQGD